MVEGDVATNVTDHTISSTDESLPQEQAENFEKLRKFTEAFDAEHGTNLWEAIKKNVREYGKM